MVVDLVLFVDVVCWFGFWFGCVSVLGFVFCVLGELVVLWG